MKLTKMRQQIADEFIKCLKEDTIPWERGWQSSGYPVNALNSTPYRGINMFWLRYNAELQGYKDPRWCSFKQAQNNGWHIGRGEKGTYIEFWSMYDTKTKQKLSRVEAVSLRKELGEEFAKRVKPISSNFVVFNAEQIEGIPEYVYEKEPLNEKYLVEHRDELIKNLDVNFYEGGDRAFYRPVADSITMPEMEKFKNTYSYMATFLHEAGHATGHENRLNRNMNGIFGTPGYAREELRAEMASAFTAQTIGMPDVEEMEHLENHKAYIQNWIEVLEKNPNELFYAMIDAEKISDYLIEKGGFAIEINEYKELSANKQLETGNTEEVNQNENLDKVDKYQKNIMEKNSIKLEAVREVRPEIYFTPQQATRLRLDLKGYQNHDMSKYSQEMMDALKVGKPVMEYMNEGMKLEEIVSSKINEIDKICNINNPEYTNRVICSAFSHNVREYDDLANLYYDNIGKNEDNIVLEDGIAGSLIKKYSALEQPNVFQKEKLNIESSMLQNEAVLEQNNHIIEEVDAEIELEIVAD